MTAADSFFCDRCATALTPGAGNFYIVRIEAIADPTPPEVVEEDLKRDFGAEIKRIFEEAKEFSEQELLDQVYRRVMLSLCQRCYEGWIEDPVGGES